MISNKRVLLNFNSANSFALALNRVLREGDTPVMLPNLQSGTIEQFQDHFDCILSDSNFVQSIVYEDWDFDVLKTQELIFFTSGSTGQPVRVVKLWEQLVAEVEVIHRLAEGNIGDAQIVSTVGHQHLYGFLFRVLWPSLKQVRTFASQIVFPEELLTLEQENFVLITSPAFLKRLDHIDGSTLKCRWVVSSGGLLPKEGVVNCRKVLLQTPLEVLGSTETGAVATRQQNSENSWWEPLREVTISQGEDRRLLVDSPFCSPNPFLMGDKFCWQESGKFQLLGRADRIVKIEEKRLSLDEMETRLCDNQWVEEAHLLAIQKGRQQVVAVVVLSNEGRKKLNELGKLKFGQLLKAHLANHFDPLVLPRMFRFPLRLERNAQAKVEYQKLMELFDAEV